MDGVEFLALLTLFSNIFLGYLLLLVLLNFMGKKGLLKGALKFLRNNAKLFSFIVALTATTGSLYFSEIRGFTPCIMCWYQRILMYPLTFIFATALIKKTKDAHWYVLPLSILGVVLAGYHYYLQISPEQLAPCSTVGFSVSCSQRFTTNFGYITIPWMSLSAFVLISLLMLLSSGKLGKSTKT